MPNGTPLETLTGKNAVLYGAGGALGNVIASTLAARGATVFLTGHRPEPLERVSAAIRSAGGRAEVAVLDAFDEDAVDRQAAEMVAAVGSIDLSLNLVPRGDVQRSDLVDMSTSDFLRAITAGATTNFLTARAAARQMVSQGSGVILTLNSGSAGGGGPTMGSTAAADGAMDSLVRRLASELGPHGVRVVGIRTSGVADTLTPEKLRAVNPAMDLDAEAFQGLLTMLDQLRLLKRSPVAQDVADAVAFLASDQARSITATFLNVSSGTTID